jgi:hypothetical protein
MLVVLISVLKAAFDRVRLFQGLGYKACKRSQQGMRLASEISSLYHAKADFPHIKKGKNYCLRNTMNLKYG